MIHFEKPPDPARLRGALGRAAPEDPPLHDPRLLSRRDLLQRSGMLAAAALLTPAFLGERGWDRPALAAHGPDLETDTFNGLAAFIVPGGDPYSVHQGVTSATPGGVEACTGLFMGPTLDLVGLAPPPFPGFGALVAFILNNVALAVHPAPAGPFDSPFANLSFAEKVTVFAVIEGGLAGPELAPLPESLTVFTAFISYSEAGVLIPEDCTLDGVPVGWALTGYDGVADGRDAFKGYYQNRRSAR
jgi:hypothetical protein